MGDFFVVHRAISPAVVGVQRLEDGGPQILDQETFQACQGAWLSPRCPSSKPPSYSEVCARIADDPNAAMLEWYKQARVEFSDLTGMQ